MQDFRKLKVWAKAHALTLEIYRLTASFPASELYGLTGQLRRASSGIGANLAEGCGRGSDADFRRFVQIAHGSASELDYHLLLAHDLGFIEAGRHATAAAAVHEVKANLGSLLKTLRAEPARHAGEAP